jgi:hypothetical protein
MKQPARSARRWMSFSCASWASLVTNSAAPPSLRAALRKLHFDLAGAPVPELLSALLQVADPNRIHYGSDWPFTPTHICEALLSALNNSPLLDEPLRNKVMSGNARHLFTRLSDFHDVRGAWRSIRHVIAVAVPDSVRAPSRGTREGASIG